MRELKATIYTGEQYEKALTVLLPKREEYLPALWAFCSSKELNYEVRKLDQKIIAANMTVVKVPFDLERWQKNAAEEYPNGLPEAHSEDPTQWLFKGHPKGSTDPLQVAVARPLGYRWPDQEPDDLDALAEADGIVPIPSVRGEPPAAERSREVLKVAFGRDWSPPLEHRLLTD